MADVVGFVGLGEMGGAMAGRLLTQGHDLRVHDLSGEAVQGLVEQGAMAEPSAAAVAAASSHVGVCVPAAEHVRAVVRGDQGLLAGARPGLSVAVHSTIEPAAVRDLSCEAAERGVVLFDAGVAGGAHRAEVGDLAITVGVPDGGVPEAAQPALSACGGLVVECGPVGAGMATKVANNVMTYLQQAAISAAFEVCRAGSGDTEVLMDVWRHTGMLGDLTEQFAPLLSMAPDDKAGPDLGPYLRTTIGLAEKDLDIAVRLAAEVDRAAPILEATRDNMEQVYGMAAD